MFKGVPHLKVTYNQLLHYGIHIGHTFTNSLVFSAWLVYSYIKNILIINLYKSIYHWKTGFFGLATACKTRGPVWFINLHKGFSSIVKNASIMCGEMSWTDNWIHGFLSNYATMSRVFRKLNKYYCGAYRPKQTWVFKNRNEWLLSRKTWPRALFVSSVYYSYWPVREALYLGSPCFGVVDTNTISDFVTIPFPGNDESLKCVTFYNDSIANFILAKKFKGVIRWYNKIRVSRRLMSFKLWLRNKWFSDKFKISSNLNYVKKSIENPFFYANSQKYLSKGIDFYFSRNYGLDYSSGYFTITDKTELSGHDFNLLFKYSVHKHASILYKLLSLASIRHYWSSKITRFNLKRILLSKNRSSLFYSKNFLVSQFKTNFFMRILWRGRFSNSRFISGRYNYRVLYSKFGFRFLKYLFSIRYSRYFSMSSDYYALNFMYFKTISSILAPSYKSSNLLYDRIGHRSLQRDKPVNFVNGFCRQIISKNKSFWLFSTRYFRTLKLDQQKRRFFISILRKYLRKESNFKKKKLLRSYLKRILYVYYKIRKLLIYRHNDNIIGRRLRKYHRTYKIRLRRFYRKLMRKVQFNKFKFHVSLGALDSRRRRIFLNKNFKLFQKSLNKNKKIKKTQKLLSLRRLNLNYRYYSIYRSLSSFKFNNILNNNISNIKNYTKNKFISFTPKVISLNKLFFRKIRSKYFSRRKYSYYLSNKNSTYTKKSKYVQEISSYFLVNFESYILLYLKKIFLSIFSSKNKINNYKLLLRNLFFFINSLIEKNNKSLNWTKQNINTVSLSILKSLHNWNISLLLDNNYLPNNNNNNLFNNKLESNLFSTYLLKTQLFIFFNYMRHVSLGQYNNNLYSVSNNDLLLSKHLFSDLSYINLYNWWYFLNQYNNNLIWFKSMSEYPVYINTIKYINIIYLFYFHISLFSSMRSISLSSIKNNNLLIWN